MSTYTAGSDGKTLVIDAVDIVELIGKTVSLRRNGSRFVGLCPFHQEKTPSFSVNPGKRMFYCFGCKASGNAIDFVMKRDRVEFKEALHLLAREYNVELPRLGPSTDNTGERQALLEAHSAAATLFENLLFHPTGGQAAREYLKSRGFTGESAKRFRIGVAADAWDNLLRSEQMRKFTPQLLALGGLLKPRAEGAGYYDTFRNRLMFPIRDETGRIIAFGGRVMPGSEDPAKYLNSPETPLFSKSRSVFGLDLARQKIVESRTVAVVEGYTDVVMAHQFGATNVVSVLGTAMTEQHVNLLRRFADRIVLLFDADTAGDTAVDRTVQLFLTQPVEIAIASMPDGVDPDEFLLAHGAEGFNKLLADAEDALSYKWRQLARRFASDRDLTGRQRAVKSYLDLLAGARGEGPIDPIRWGQALTRVSRLTGMPAEDLNRLFKANPRPRRVRGESARTGPAAQSKRRGPTDVAHDTLESLAESESGHASSGGTTAAEGDDDRQPTGSRAQLRAQRWILGALLAEPQRWQAVQKHVHVDDFTDARLRVIAEAYWNHQRDEGEPELAEFLSALDELSKRLSVEVVSEVEELGGPAKAQNAALEMFDDSRRRANETRMLADIVRDGETGESDELAARFAELTRAMKDKPHDLRRFGPAKQ